MTERQDGEEPVIRDKRRIDPETGDVRRPEAAGDPAASGAPEAEGDIADVDGVDDLIQAEGPDVESPEGGMPDIEVVEVSSESLTDADRSILDAAEVDLVAEMRNDMLRAQAELVNFRSRVERDRQANREAVIAEVIRSLLPAVDDLARAEAHGDLPEGSALAVVASKLRAGFEKFGLRPVGEKGEAFDPKFHEALVQLPSADVDGPVVADVIEVGYALGERLVRPAKVAVSVPA